MATQKIDICFQTGLKSKEKWMGGDTDESMPLPQVDFGHFSGQLANPIMPNAIVASKVRARIKREARTDVQ